MRFVKVCGKYVEISRDYYNLNKIKFYLEETKSEYEFSHYLAINQFSTYCDYCKVRGFIDFTESELLQVEKKFNEFIFENCVSYE